LTFTNWHGWDIGDHPHNFEPCGYDDNSVVGHHQDVLPGLDPTPEDDAELPGVDTNFDAEPTGVEVDSDYVSQEHTRVDGLGNKIKRWRQLKHHAPNQARSQALSL
jgi:hypothetical protein